MATAPADYGVLTQTVAIAGSLIGAASAIRLAWVRRARWMPPNETVDGGVIRVTGVICAVLIGLLFLLRNQVSLIATVIIAVTCLVLTLLALIISIYVNTTYSYIRRTHTSRTTTTETRFLGGNRLTGEAELLRQQPNAPSIQQLFDYSNNRPDKVWTPGSIAYIQILSTIGFIGLQTSGSIALAATAIAFSVAYAQPLPA